MGTGFWDSGLAGGCGGHRCMGASPRLPLRPSYCSQPCMCLEGSCRQRLPNQEPLRAGARAGTSTLGWFPPRPLPGACDGIDAVGNFPPTRDSYQTAADVSCTCCGSSIGECASQRFPRGATRAFSFWGARAPPFEYSTLDFPILNSWGDFRGPVSNPFLGPAVSRHFRVLLKAF